MDSVANFHIRLADTDDDEFILGLVNRFVDGFELPPGAVPVSAPNISASISPGICMTNRRAPMCSLPKTMTESASASSTCRP